MQRLEVSGAVRPIYGSLGFKRLTGIRVFFPAYDYLSVHSDANHPNIRFLCVKWVTKLNLCSDYSLYTG